MLVIRRLYTYTICGISLLLLAIGSINLLEIAAAAAVDMLAGTQLIHETGEALRQDISLYLALAVVAAPIWAFHWHLARRWSDDSGLTSDSRSAIRTAYFAVVLAVAIITLSNTVMDTIDTMLSRLLDLTVFTDGRESVRWIVIASVALVAWCYHALVAHREAVSAPQSGIPSWPLRVYLYGAALMSGFMLLTGLVLVLQLGLDTLIEQQAISPGRIWWASTLATSVSLLVVGGAVWWTHWWYASSLLSRGAAWVIAEAGSGLRGVYHYAFVLAGAVALLVGAGIAVSEIVRALLSVDPGPGVDPLWARMAEPMLIAAPFIGAWLLHLRWVNQECRLLRGEEEEASVERLSGYIASLAGLSAAAVCIGYLLGLGFDSMLYGAGLIEERQAFSAGEISAFVAFAIVGILLWGWYWREIRVRSLGDRETERRSTSRRAYLYLVLTGTTLALLSSLAFALYQVLQLLLGVGLSEALVSDLGVILGVVVVASGLAAYHLLLLREDMRPAMPASAEPEPLPVPSSPETASLTLTLSGAGDATLREILVDLQRRLPANITLSESIASAAQTAGAEPVATVELSEQQPRTHTESEDPGPPARIPG